MGHGARYGYGLSTGKFGDQSETIEVHTAELNIARTAVLDYFTDQRDEIPPSNQIFCWENGMGMELNTNRFLSEVCDELGNYVALILHLISTLKDSIFRYTHHTSRFTPHTPHITYHNTPTPHITTYTTLQHKVFLLTFFFIIFCYI